MGRGEVGVPVLAGKPSSALLGEFRLSLYECSVCRPHLEVLHPLYTSCYLYLFCSSLKDAFYQIEVYISSADVFPGVSKDCNLDVVLYDIHWFLPMTAT